MPWGTGGWASGLSTAESRGAESQQGAIRELPQPRCSGHCLSVERDSGAWDQTLRIFWTSFEGSPPFSPHPSLVLL